MTAVVDFSPTQPVERGGAATGEVGPGSNTGQKVGGLVDAVTLVFSALTLEDWRLTQMPHLLARLFGFRDEVVAAPIRDRMWQFYPQSCVFVDREGEVVGKIGLGDRNGTVCISLMGTGTRWVRSWDNTARVVNELRGRITRCDVAFDDYHGEHLNVHALRDDALAGAFAEGGRPPGSRFISDEGSGKGCSLYVGSKGHKELNAYEKGKQLGNPASPWVRVECRMYAKHQFIPVEILTRPLDYLRGAYSHLSSLLVGVCTRIKTTRAQVEASAVALIRWAKTQMGPSLNLIAEAVGEGFAEFLREHIVREGHPGRFKGIAKGARLTELFREELACHASA